MLKTQGLVLSGKDALFELQNIELGEPQPNGPSPFGSHFKRRIAAYS